jgi:hypothetical protein
MGNFMEIEINDNFEILHLADKPRVRTTFEMEEAEILKADLMGGEMFEEGE